MSDNQPDFSLDESAEDLYRQFKGIDDSVRADLSLRLESELMAFLRGEEERLDHYRLLMAKAVCTFIDILTNSKIAGPGRENNHEIKALINILKKISENPQCRARLQCRFRGQQYTEGSGETMADGSELYDYELSLGSLILDFQMARVIEERGRKGGRFLHARLMKAFKSMSAMNIFNFSIDIGEGEDLQPARIAATIRALVSYYQAGAGRDKFLVHDEYGNPSINLTLLAAVNRVKPSSLKGLVEKIKPKIIEDAPGGELSRFTTVYDVIVATSRFKKDLPPIPLEVNSVQQLMLNNRIDSKTTADAVRVSRVVLARYGDNLKMATEIIASIQREGYRKIQADIMGRRLSLATRFLDLAEDKEDRTILHNEALRNIEDGLDQVSDTIYAKISVKGEEVSSVNQQGHSSSWSLHEKILSLLSFFKQRSTTRKKVRDIANHDIQFYDEDYEVIARSFNVSVLDATRLVALLRDCFEANGRFRRAFFEKNIPEFALYGSRVFEFLWHYLKELESRNDRVIFLNSIQILIDRLDDPGQAFRILLSDIFLQPDGLDFSDRNGLILGTILLRKYNKEGKNNIELTPEEVLLVREGMNEEMLLVARQFFKGHQGVVIKKFRTITEQLFAASARKALGKGEKPPRFLLHLLREMIIFFSLLGGDMSLAVLKRVIGEFGNPGSEYFKKMKDKNELRFVLQLLQAAVRGIKRFSDPGSADLVHAVVSQQEAFIRLNGDRAHRLNVERMMERIMTS